MRPVDTLAVAWQGIGRRRLRTALTAVSLTIGVLALVVVQSAQSLVHQATLRRAILQNGPAVTVRVQLADGVDPDRDAAQLWWRARLDRLTVSTSHATAVYNSYSSVNLIAGSGTVTPIDLITTDTNLRSIRPLPVLAGSWFTSPRLCPEFVLNRAAAAALAPLHGPYVIQAADGGHRLTVAVVGVIDDGNSTPEGYLPFSAQPALATAGLRPIARSILVSGAVNRDALAGQAATVGRLTGLAAELGDVSRVDTVDEYADQLATQRRLFLAIAILCLLVGSLGILNIGLSTLHERAEELSLRRALGATRTAVAVIMMLESQLVALVAAGIAVAGAYLAVPSALRAMTTIDIAAADPHGCRSRRCCVQPPVDSSSDLGTSTAIPSEAVRSPGRI